MKRDRLIQLACLLVMLAALAVGGWGYYTGRAFVALVACAVFPAASVLVVVTFWRLFAPPPT